MQSSSVRLEARSKKGKERIARDGADGWTVEQVAPRVQFSSEPGPWLLIGNGNPGASRWVHATNDANFAVHLNT